jgi:hypothetical protein
MSTASDVIEATMTITRDDLSILDRVCKLAVEDGRDAARLPDRGIAALRGALAAANDSTSTVFGRRGGHAYLFGFLDGVSEVWEALELLDFLEEVAP